MPTFTPGDTVPPTALFSASPDINLDALGTDRTPAGWPTNGKAAAIEVELTATTAFERDGEIKVAVSEPGALNPITGATTDASGVWSGWQGDVVGFSGVDAYYLDKFGGWRTDYLSPSGSGVNSNRVDSTTTATPGNGVDLRARVRSADWDEAASRRICRSSNGLFGGGASDWTTQLMLTAAGVRADLKLFIGGLPPAFNSHVTVTAPWSAFSEVDGEWLGIRFTFDASTEVGTFYQDTSASPGLNSWTSVHSAAMTDSMPYMAGDMHIGSVPLTKPGLNGDISHFAAFDGTGQLIHELALDAMDDTDDLAWTGAANSLSRSAIQAGFAVGSIIPATKRLRIDLDSPFNVNDWRLIVAAQTGTVTVDEIVLEMANRGPRLGLYR